MNLYKLQTQARQDFIDNYYFPTYRVWPKTIIDKDILLKAVNSAVELVPTFKTKFIYHNELLYLTDNDLPIVIKEIDTDGNTVYFGGIETNYYPWLISYSDDKIDFTTNHALCDGIGAISFIRCVLGYYMQHAGLIDKYVDHVYSNVDKAKLFENSAEDCYDPNIPPLGTPKRSPLSKFPKKLTNQASGTLFKFDASIIKREARHSEVSNFAVFSYYFAKAIERYFDGQDFTAMICVPFNARGILNSITTMNCFLPIPIIYRSKMMRDKKAEQIETVFRSQMDIETDICNLNAEFKRRKEQNELYSKNPQMLYQRAEDNKKDDANMAFIVYTHITKLDFPDYIEDFLYDIQALISNSYLPMPLAVGFTFKGKINLLFNDITENDEIVKHFKDILIENNIDYEIEENMTSTKQLYKWDGAKNNMKGY